MVVVEVPENIVSQRFLSGQRMSEAGHLDLVSEDEEDEEDVGGDMKLPGVHRGCVCVRVCVCAMCMR
jgi:hypothetical protein